MGGTDLTKNLGLIKLLAKDYKLPIIIVSAIQNDHGDESFRHIYDLSSILVALEI
jgi:hypothetical protein